MNRGWPDWMFAAFAIGGWELFDLIARRWHIPHIRYAGALVVAICVIVLAVRYIYRWWYRRQHPHVEDPDEWKQY